MRIDTIENFYKRLKLCKERTIFINSFAAIPLYFHPSRDLHPPGCHTQSLDTRKQGAFMLVFVGLGNGKIKRNVKAALRRRFWRKMKKKTKKIQNRISKTKKRLFLF